MSLEVKATTIEELWQITQQNKGKKRYELVRGEIREMSPAGWLHGIITGEIHGVLRDYLKKNNLGRLTAAETGYILSTEGDVPTVRAPDVGFIATERIPDQLPESGYVPFAPDLAVEVVSPGNTIAQITEKVTDFLDAGTRVIWVVYPTTKTINVHTAAGTRSYDVSDQIDGGDVLPGFTIAVKDIFTS